MAMDVRDAHGVIRTIKGNGDGTSGAPFIGEHDLGGVTLGSPVSGASLPTGGAGLFGWFSAIWTALISRLPAALVENRLAVVQPDATITSTITAADQSVVLQVPSGASSFSVDVRGLVTATLTFERTINGTDWTAIGMFTAGTPVTGSTTTANGSYHGNCSASNAVRVRCTAISGAQTITVKIEAGSGTGTITIGNPLRLYDGVNNTQATIVPANTAPAATATGLVASLHPLGNGVTLQASATTGLNTYRRLGLSTASTAQQIKASAGALYGYTITNTGTASRFVKFYDKATTPSTTLPTDTPKLTIAIPAGQTISLMLPIGIPFAAGIAVTATTGVADADGTAPGATDVIANIIYL